MGPISDRRARVRSEVGGRLRGILDLAEAARIVNISRTGALIETSVPAAVGSSRSLQLTVEGHVVDVKACVRRLTRIGQEPQVLYAIGVEFVSPHEDLTDLVASFIAQSQMD